MVLWFLLFQVEQQIIHILDWPNGYTSNQKDISNLNPGTYNVTITDNGNKVELEFDIVEPNILQLSANLSNFNDLIFHASGNNGSIDLTMSGGTNNYTYSDSPNGFTSSAADLNNLIAGEYQVVVNDLMDVLLLTYTLNQPTAISVSGTFSDYTVLVFRVMAQTMVPILMLVVVFRQWIKLCLLLDRANVYI